MSHPKHLFKRILNHPLPIKNLIYRKLTRLFPATSDFGRPHYKHCLEEATSQAIKLGHKKISVIEFGVAGGRGLVCIESLCAQLSKRHPIEYDIYGFDSGEGLPNPQGYKDLPYKFGAEFYKMNIEEVRKKAPKSKLILGDVKNTVGTAFDKSRPAPIGAIFFDLDYYSSTVAALELFNMYNEKYFLPRVQCYFDDVDCIESLGERLAIKEFNEKNVVKKIQNNYATQQRDEIFGYKIFEYHQFEHKDYCKILMGRHDI